MAESLQSEVECESLGAESNVIEPESHQPVVESQPQGAESEHINVESEVKTDQDTDQFVEASSDRPESPPEADEFHDAPDESEASSQNATEAQQDSPSLAEVEGQLKSLDITNSQDVNNVNTETLNTNSEEKVSESSVQPQKQIEQNVQVCLEREVKIVETQPKVENVESVNTPSESS